MALARGRLSSGPEGDCLAVVEPTEPPALKPEIELTGPQPCCTDAVHLQMSLAMVGSQQLKAHLAIESKAGEATITHSALRQGRTLASEACTD